MASDTSRPRYVQVELGSVVYTLDNQKLGTVGEKRGENFKIKTPFLQRDYWLRTDSVRSAEPGQPVVLNVDRAHLDDIKLSEAPPTN